MMKKIVVVVQIVFFLSCFLSTNICYGEIQDTKHDFSKASWNTTGEICIVCHTPHNADTSVIKSLLWNHEISTVDNYTLYESPTLEKQPQQPREMSKTCLSCHDGTVALDSFGGNQGDTNITGDALIGTDLSDDHPISIWWDHQTCDQSACHNSTKGGGDVLPFFDHYVECPTCHNVHGSNYEALLRLPLERSMICFHCHDK